jgi:hypothetical protein
MARQASSLIAPDPLLSSSSSNLLKEAEEEEGGQGEERSEGVKTKVGAEIPAAPGNAAGTAVKRPRFRRYNKDRADQTLGKLHSSLRHIQAFIGKKKMK